MESIYHEIQLPEHCAMNRAIPADVILTYGKLTPKGRERFEKHFQSARLVFCVKETDLPAVQRKSNDGSVPELQIIEVTVKNNRVGYFEQLAFARDIMQAFSYPVLLVVKYGAYQYRFFAAKTHLGKHNEFKSIVEEIQCSGWIHYKSSLLRQFDTATLHNMMVYFRCSKSIAELCENLMGMFAKHQEAYRKTRNNIKRRKARSQFEYAASADQFNESRLNGLDGTEKYR